MAFLSDFIDEKDYFQSCKEDKSTRHTLTVGLEDSTYCYVSIFVKVVVTFLLGFEKWIQAISRK